MVSGLLLFKRDCQSVQSLFVVNGGFEVQKSFQEKNLGGPRNPGIWLRTTHWAVRLLALKRWRHVSLRLSEEPSSLVHILTLSSVPAMLLSLDQSGKLLPIDWSDSRVFSSALTWSQVLVSWRSTWCFDTRDLILLDCIDQFFYCLLQEVNFPHFHLLILLNPRLNSIEPGLVKLLRLDKHLDPLFLLSLEVLDYGLVVDEMFFILGEVLSAHIFDLFKFFVVLLVNVSVVRVYLLCRCDHVVFQLVYLFSLLRCQVVAQTV